VEEETKIGLRLGWVFLVGF